jgi:hypothetical protein
LETCRVEDIMPFYNLPRLLAVGSKGPTNKIMVSKMIYLSQRPGKRGNRMLLVLTVGVGEERKVRGEKGRGR